MFCFSPVIVEKDLMRAMKLLLHCRAVLGKVLLVGYFYSLASLDVWKSALKN